MSVTRWWADFQLLMEPGLMWLAGLPQAIWDNVLNRPLEVGVVLLQAMTAIIAHAILHHTLGFDAPPRRIFRIESLAKLAAAREARARKRQNGKVIIASSNWSTQLQA